MSRTKLVGIGVMTLLLSACGNHQVGYTCDVTLEPVFSQGDCVQSENYYKQPDTGLPDIGRDDTHGIGGSAPDDPDSTPDAVNPNQDVEGSDNQDAEGGQDTGTDQRSSKGNASANNGKGGNYDKTGHHDNGKGNSPNRP